jgi:epoxyqueuosine reductase
VSRERLTRELRQHALEAGFDQVGVALAGPLDRDADALSTWLARGHHAGMEWMSRHGDRRRDPTGLLPGCASVVSLAMNYLADPDEEEVPGSARVARYARGRDYHKVMGKRVRRLATWLEEASGRPSRAFVDTGPVLERAWAERAGIGWIGKNANLVSRRYGSWLLLCEILTAADLVPDPGPHADFCGSCTTCIDVCPTGAIVEPGVVDSSKCVSYWTIEHRGPIPESVREGIGEWIFGCDDCQSVCPWSRKFGAGRTDDLFERRKDLTALDPVEILAADETTFRARYSGTSLMRARWDGMRRNACVVLGNRRDSDSVCALENARSDADPVVREHADWALGRIRGSG